jgi:hypothetical protein
MGWQPIESAPKDGTWILLRGGDDRENYVGPCVAAFFETRGNLYEWVYSFWDGDWRSSYENPSEWMPIP